MDLLGPREKLKRRSSVRGSADFESEKVQDVVDTTVPRPSSPSLLLNFFTTPLRRIYLSYLYLRLGASFPKRGNIKERVLPRTKKDAIHDAPNACRPLDGGALPPKFDVLYADTPTLANSVTIIIRRIHHHSLGHGNP